MRNFANIYLERSKESALFSTYEELRKLHQKRFHLRMGKLYNQLKFAKPWKLNEEKITVLMNISMHNEAFRRFSQLSVRFKVTTPTKEISFLAMNYLRI